MPIHWCGCVHTKHVHKLHILIKYCHSIDYSSHKIIRSLACLSHCISTCTIWPKSKVDQQNRQILGLKSNKNGSFNTLVTHFNTMMVLILVEILCNLLTEYDQIDLVNFTAYTQCPYKG